MYRSSQEMMVEFREKMRGGEGVIQIRNLFKEGDLKGKTRLVAEITIPIGGSIGYHQHDNEEEIFYFKSGIGRVQDGDQTLEVMPGDALVTGDGKGHSVINIGNEPLILMAVILTY